VGKTNMRLVTYRFAFSDGWECCRADAKWYIKGARCYDIRFCRESQEIKKRSCIYDLWMMEKQQDEKGLSGVANEDGMLEIGKIKSRASVCLRKRLDD